MNEDKKRILNMVAEGKLSADEAEMLLEQVPQERTSSVQPQARASSDRMLRIRVTGYEGDKQSPINVNVNLPLKVARIAGRLATAALPQSAHATLQEQHIDISTLDFDELIDALEDTGGDIVNVQSHSDEDNVNVRIYVE